MINTVRSFPYILHAITGFVLNLQEKTPGADNSLKWWKHIAATKEIPKLHFSIFCCLQNTGQMDILNVYY